MGAVCDLQEEMKGPSEAKSLPPALGGNFLTSDGLSMSLPRNINLLFWKLPCL
jgi:hypothetical protein